MFIESAKGGCVIARIDRYMARSGGLIEVESYARENLQPRAVKLRRGKSYFASKSFKIEISLLPGTFFQLPLPSLHRMTITSPPPPAEHCLHIRA